MRRAQRAFIVFSIGLVAAPAIATTGWLITDADRTKAMRIATEQAAQRARSDRSCYLPAAAKQCTIKKGLWTCMAENPTKPSDCGMRGRWKKAIPGT